MQNVQQRIKISNPYTQLALTATKKNPGQGRRGKIHVVSPFLATPLSMATKFKALAEARPRPLKSKRDNVAILAVDLLGCLWTL